MRVIFVSKAIENLRFLGFIELCSGFVGGCVVKSIIAQFYCVCRRIVLELYRLMIRSKCRSELDDGISLRKIYGSAEFLKETFGLP
jgi:hypothetical protein